VEVRTTSTSRRSIFAKELALIKRAAGDEAYWAAVITSNMQLQLQIHLSDGQTEATTWSFADTQRIADKLEKEIYGSTSNEQKWCKEELSIRLIEFKDWWEIMGIQALRTTNKISPYVLDIQ